MAKENELLFAIGLSKIINQNLKNLKEIKMKLKEKTSQFRRDWRGILECEFCGETREDNSGYDDRNYYDNVIPNMECSKCGKSTISEGGEIDFIPVVVPEGVQI